MLFNVLCGEASKFITSILIKYCLQLNVLNPFIISLCVDCSKSSLDQVCEIFLGRKDIRQAQDTVAEGVNGNCIRYAFVSIDNTLEFFSKYSD